MVVEDVGYQVQCVFHGYIAFFSLELHGLTQRYVHIVTLKSCPSILDTHV